MVHEDDETRASGRPGPVPSPAELEPGRHLLGPHAVGRRVVVRRLLPGQTGPTGGPAFTDLLGDLVAWPAPGAAPEERIAVVLGVDGGRTAVPLRDIVSGKPVPPRPSVRMRVTPAEAERHALALWAGVEHQPLGAWVLRCDPAPVGRLLKRANSCLALGHPGVALEEAAAAVARFYADRDRDALAQVEVESAVDRDLRALGWVEVPGGEAGFWLASVASVRRGVRRGGRADPDLPAALGLAGPWREESGPRLRVGLGPPAEPVGAVQAAVDGDWVGVHGLQVATTLQRRGLATLLLDDALEWGAEQGATTAWLHVEADNAPARALYAALGFTEHHETRYLTPSD